MNIVILIFSLTLKFVMLIRSKYCNPDPYSYRNPDPYTHIVILILCSLTHNHEPTRNIRVKLLSGKHAVSVDIVKGDLSPQLVRALHEEWKKHQGTPNEYKRWLQKKITDSCRKALGMRSNPVSAKVCNEIHWLKFIFDIVNMILVFMIRAHNKNLYS